MKSVGYIFLDQFDSWLIREKNGYLHQNGYWVLKNCQFACPNHSQYVNQFSFILNKTSTKRKMHLTFISHYFLDMLIVRLKKWNRKKTNKKNWFLFIFYVWSNINRTIQLNTTITVQRLAAENWSAAKHIKFATIKNFCLLPDHNTPKQTPYSYCLCPKTSVKLLSLSLSFSLACSIDRSDR